MDSKKKPNLSKPRKYVTNQSMLSVGDVTLTWWVGVGCEMRVEVWGTGSPRMLNALFMETEDDKLSQWAASFCLRPSCA